MGDIRNQNLCDFMRAQNKAIEEDATMFMKSWTKFADIDSETEVRGG